MWTKIKTILLAAAAVAVAALVWLAAAEVRDARLTVESGGSIGVTPQMIQSIKSIGEWEFLSVADEEMVDTVRRGLLSDDHLVRIYYGRLRIGVNMHSAGPRWIQVYGDSVSVTLPRVGLLDDDFIDEARTVSFYESGKWSAADREAMYAQAYRRMLANCLTLENIRQAEESARAQMGNIMRQLGFRAVTVRFDEGTRKTK